MVDAQDIDALLIGALYGELTLADEARLAAHLESHPVDRTALDDLTRARAVVRESRIFAVQLEPPQAISALLLQEAARRAPKRVTAVEAERDGWFQRFVRSFVAHPAMAAAAMLVLVVGVAGTLYLNHDKQFADEAAPAAATRQEAPAGPAIAAPAPEDNFRSADKSAASSAGSAAGGAMMGSGSAYGADLAETERKAGKDTARARNDDDSIIDGKLDQQKAKVAHAGPRDGLVVHTPPTLAPKEMPPTTPKVALEEGAKQEIARGAPGGGAAMDPSSNTNTGYAPPPPPQAPPANAAPPAAQPSPTTSSVARERTIDHAPAADNNNAGDSALVAWAKEQHLRVQALVKAGSCQDAAKVALDISAKAPEYYAQYVATDRAVKPCATYINDARDKEAEKSQKARAQKRVNANEPAPAHSDLK